MGNIMVLAELSPQEHERLELYVETMHEKLAKAGFSTVYAAGLEGWVDITMRPNDQTKKGPSPSPQSQR